MVSTRMLREKMTRNYTSISYNNNLFISNAPSVVLVSITKKLIFTREFEFGETHAMRLHSAYTTGKVNCSTSTSSPPNRLLAYRVL